MSVKAEAKRRCVESLQQTQKEIIERFVRDMLELNRIIKNVKALPEE